MSRKRLLRRIKNLTNKSKWATVRINGEIIAPLEELIKNARDEFNMPLFRNKSDAVTQAVKEFLRKYSEGTQAKG